MEEKLKRIEEVERKLRRFERKGYKLMAELRAIEAYDCSLSAKWADDSFARTIKWSNGTINTAREWALKEIEK